MTELASRTAGGALGLALLLSPLAGLVCADGPDANPGMACCRKDAHRCNMPEKSDKDCCKPDRSSKNPASVEASFRTSIDARGDPHAAVCVASVTAPDAGHKVIPFSPSRGSPRLLTNRPLDTPLLA